MLTKPKFCNAGLGRFRWAVASGLLFALFYAGMAGISGRTNYLLRGLLVAAVLIPLSYFLLYAKAVEWNRLAEERRLMMPTQKRAEQIVARKSLKKQGRIRTALLMFAIWCGFFLLIAVLTPSFPAAIRWVATIIASAWYGVWMVLQHRKTFHDE